MNMKVKQGGGGGAVVKQMMSHSLKTQRSVELPNTLIIAYAIMKNQFITTN